MEGTSTLCITVQGSYKAVLDPHSLFHRLGGPRAKTPQPLSKPLHRNNGYAPLHLTSFGYQHPPGVITYATNHTTPEVIRILAASQPVEPGRSPLQILLETDAPYMVPANLTEHQRTAFELKSSTR